MNRHNCCPERDLKSAAKWGLIAWAIVMLVAIATFLPGEVYAQEIHSVEQDRELTQFERALVERFNIYLGVSRNGLVEELGPPAAMDEQTVCLPIHGTEKCFTFDRYLYLITEMPKHALVFVIGQEDPADGIEGNTVHAWTIRPMVQAELESFVSDDPFKRHF